MNETIHIHGIGSEMQGVGRLADGRAAFVPGALPGETVEIRIRKSKDRFVEAELVRVIEPCADRTAPACPLYGKCGGCSTQHMTYEASLQHKHTRVRDALIRVGGQTDPDVRPTVASDPILHTRNKAEYDCGNDPATGKRALGVHLGASHSVLPVDDCMLQHTLSIKALNAVRALNIERSLSGVVTRVTRNDELMLILTGPVNALADETGLTAKLRAALPLCRRWSACTTAA